MRNILKYSYKKIVKGKNDPNNIALQLKLKKQNFIAAHILLEIYYFDYIIVNQDEAIVFNNDSKMYTWTPRREYAAIYFGEENNYIKLTIYAIITNKGDLLYMITDSNNNSYVFQYFLQEVLKYLTKKYVIYEIIKIINRTEINFCFNWMVQAFTNQKDYKVISKIMG